MGEGVLKEHFKQIAIALREKNCFFMRFVQNIQ